jgi:putative spermidine/putrescine transport system permease protein
MLFILLWFVIPLARFFSLAFSDQSGTFAIFRTLFESQAYRRVLLLTLGNAALVTAITVTLAWPVAYLLSRLRGAWLAFALYGVLFPFWISVLVRTFSWMLLLERHGPINRLLSATGQTDGPLPLLFNDTGVLIGTIHVLLPYAILPLYAAMRRVDRRLMLASDGLGASLLYSFWRIYLPLVLPGLLGAGVIVAILSLGFYITPALLGGASAITLSTLISGFVTERLAWSLAAAASIVLLALVLVLLVLGRRLIPLGGGNVV